MNRRDIWLMMKMRGLGFTQKEIADRLGITQSAVQYQLAKLKKMALKEGIDIVHAEHIVIKGTVGIY